MSSRSLSSNAEERCYDPEDNLKFRRQAGEAERRFEHIADPRQRRNEIAAASFRDTGAFSTQAEAIKRQLLAWCELDIQYADRKKILDRLTDLSETRPLEECWWINKRLEIGSMIFPPPLREVGTQWLKSLPGETLDVIGTFASPKIIVVPTDVYPQGRPDVFEIPTGENESDVFAHHVWNSVGRPGYAPWMDPDHPLDLSKPLGERSNWRIGITDMAEDMPFDSSIRDGRSNEEVIAEYERRFAENGFSIMPPYAYIGMVATAMTQGKFLDQQTRTVFKKTDSTELFLPVACSRDSKINLDAVDGRASSSDLRCRPWIECDAEYTGMWHWDSSGSRILGEHQEARGNTVIEWEKPQTSQTPPLSTTPPPSRLDALLKLLGIK